MIYDDYINEDDVEVMMLIKDLKNRSLSFGEGGGGRGRMNRITESTRVPHGGNDRRKEL